MKHLLLIPTISLLILSCSQVSENYHEKSEHHFGTIEVGDVKSTAMDAFNDAYLANDMTGQEELFAENAVANVNGVETTPTAMMEGFLQGLSFSTVVKFIPTLGLPGRERAMPLALPLIHQFKPHSNGKMTKSLKSIIFTIHMIIS